MHLVVELAERRPATYFVAMLAGCAGAAASAPCGATDRAAASSSTTTSCSFSWKRSTSVLVAQRSGEDVAAAAAVLTMAPMRRPSPS